jgi:hypothetical protein
MHDPTGGIGAFLAHDGIVGAFRTKAADDEVLGGPVEFRDDIGVARLGGDRREPLLATFEDQLTGRDCQPGRQVAELP